MDRVWQRAASFVLVVFFLPMAGCLGDADDPAPATQTTGPSVPGQPNVGGPRPPTNSPDVLIEVDPDTAVFAPTWEAGQWWTYEVSGQQRPADTATLVVVRADADAYYLGSDSAFELGYNTLNDGPFISIGNPSVQRDTLAIFHSGEFNDIIGFSRPLAATWNLGFDGILFNLTKNSVRAVDTPAGPSLGIFVNGTDTAGGTIEIEYAANAEWLTRFVITNAADEPVLSYVLSDFGVTGAPEASRWVITDKNFTTARSPYYPAYMDPWKADGVGSMVFSAIMLESNHAEGWARSRIAQPDGNVVFDETVEAGLKWFFMTAPAQTGYWSLTSLSVGTIGAQDAKVDVFSYEVAVEA